MREKKLYEIGQTCFFDPGPPPTALILLDVYEFKLNVHLTHANHIVTSRAPMYIAQTLYTLYENIEY